MKKCHTCKHWTECSHNHGSTYNGYCCHSLSNRITDGDYVCDNWEDKKPKELHELNVYYDWLNRNLDKLSVEIDSHRDAGADIIYTVIHAETKQSIRLCKTSNGIYNILMINEHDVRTRYENYSFEIGTIFRFIDRLRKRICDTLEEQIQEAVNGFMR
jgi:hypothetical protein